MSKSKEVRNYPSNYAALDFGAHELQILKNDMERFRHSHSRSVSHPDSGSVVIVVSRLNSHDVLDCYRDLTKPAASFKNMKDDKSHARLLNDLGQSIASARQQSILRQGVVVNFAPKAGTGAWGFVQDRTELEIFE